MAFLKSMNTYKAHGAANPTYANSKTGGNLRVDQPLSVGRPLLDRNGNAMVRMPQVPKALQKRAREFVLMCIKGEGGVKKLVEKIYAQAIRGNFRAQEMLMNYIFGRPTESVKIESTNSHDVVITPIVKIIADNLRLDKLQKDADNAPPIVDASRIEEMEAVLNSAVNGTATVNIDPLPEDAPPKGKQNTIYKESKKKGIVKSKKKQKKKR